jgi:hypothetical protein
MTTTRKTPGAKPGATVVPLKGNTRAKGRAKKAPTYTLRAEGRTLLTTPFERIARAAAVQFFADVKSVSMYDNAARKVVARWNYGHLQPPRGA